MIATTHRIAEIQMRIQSPTFSRAGGMGLALLALASCGPDRNVFAPVCPNVSFVQPLADLNRYRPNATSMDVTDLVLQARLLKVNGACAYGNSKKQLITSVTIGMGVQRGIAMSGRHADVPVFVAVTEGPTVMDKKVFSVPVEFPSNVDQVTMTSPPIDITLPIGPNKSGAAYGVVAGFQLTPEELATNQHRAGR